MDPSELPPPHAAEFPAGSDMLVRSPLRDIEVGAPGDPAARTVPVTGGISDAIPFETDLFVGKLRVLFKLPPEQQSPEAAALLEGKKRLTWVVFQGQLKRPVSLDDLRCGMWFSRPLRLPAPFIVVPVMQWIAAKAAGVEMRLGGARPRVDGPFAASCHLINVSHPGREPDMFAAEEDTRLLFGPGAENDKPMPVGKRKSFFKHAANRAGRFWMPHHVITMAFFDQALDLFGYRMAVPPCFHVDLVNVLDGQPISFSAREESSGAWAFKFEVVHRRSMEHNARVKGALAAGKAHAIDASATNGSLGAEEAPGEEQQQQPPPHPKALRAHAIEDENASVTSL